MSKIRLIVVPLRQRWTIRRVSRRIGAFADETQALSTALRLAVFQRMRGETVEVLMQDPDGRWEDLARASPHLSRGALRL